MCSAVTAAFMVCHSFVFEGLGFPVDSNLWCCSSPGQRYLLVKLLHCSRAGNLCSQTAGSISRVSGRVRVCSRICGMNDKSKHDILPHLSSFVSKSSECIRARSWSPMLISDVALYSAVTAAFMVCHSFVFEGLGFPVDSNLWCCSSPGQRYLLVKLLHCSRAGNLCSQTAGSISRVSGRVRVCSRICEMNDKSKHDILPHLSSFVSKSSECIRARFWSPTLISDVALYSSVTTAFMVCYSSIFESLECSVDSNLWCCPSTGQRYLYSRPSFLHRVRMCFRLAETNDESKQQVWHNFRSCVSP